MQYDAMLKQLNYTPNEALVEQLKVIASNTPGYEKIEKHIMDLHDSLQVNRSFVAMSNSHNYLKIKIADALSDEERQNTIEKIERFESKYKISLEQVSGVDTYYIKGFEKA